MYRTCSVCWHGGHTTCHESQLAGSKVIGGTHTDDCMHMIFPQKYNLFKMSNMIYEAA
jgi:hypothetical protein